MSSGSLKISRLPKKWATALVCLLGLAGAWVLWGAHPGEELRELPTIDRKQLYVRTLEVLRASCTLPTGPSMSDYCRDQAEFILHFPECDARCRQLANQYAPLSVR